MHLQLERRAAQGKEVWGPLMVFENAGSECPSSFELFWRKREKGVFKGSGPKE